MPASKKKFRKFLKVIKLGKSKLAELALQNKARRLAGLKPIEVKVRECLNCQCKFESVGNRLCVKCKNDELPVLSGQEVVR